MTINTLQVEPGGVIAWILVGLIAGAVAGRLVAGRGFGCLADILVGVVGAFIGGLVLSYFTTAGWGCSAASWSR